ncbi:DNA-3-methyladenine glycosylase [Sanguibacter suaedae]|uniref:Putative 3-methyladenine DNA glycosylase n=1 Tax=Sanguibacter suaedae TaxID=2795737 RepID=A0A934I971_9MICO|nr:DNA-3-methyladenine glycosylase [Sanguibacter suaedae]MBI9115412.1 DNA-3-methyladenine glycosylase [Sanguibacter suaedae]
MSGDDVPAFDRAFFDRDPLEVARDLLGARIVHRSDEGTVAVRLTEVEAYHGAQDPGSHAFRGRTARNAVMFEGPGLLYVYRHMGLHTCVNVVCGPPGEAAAVLLRAGEVVLGRDLARRRRLAAGVVRREEDLASGPARLTVALGLSMAHAGTDLLAECSAVGLERGDGVPDVRTGPRVGVGGAGGDGEVFPWRFWIAGEPTVSTYRPASVRRPRTGQTKSPEPL